MNGYAGQGQIGAGGSTPLLNRQIVAPVRIFVNIAGRNFQVEADTLPEAEEKLTEKIAAAIEEAGAHIERMEGFLAAR